ncbi:hypothetical protein PFICI_10432 [Pestalotiopsis fici W106-1]|uniref:Heterokaryon incompatibility domain-containing protein n=1 Tax=Pestalotiopsis fici (strain W106-1 / CGMCC3.15140) TaxID=1229662 RepID=W3WWZ6_PESFW|nr:uncharacterized protein PFICI_10432 [Pestalotiopsis fici W106-1]ETS78370.1 hypothetical protein PFICI_10432 [Pestalotiopsis fici W106-1]
MFRWFQNAAKCYVSLQDVGGKSHEDRLQMMRHSRWFTRGWMLQELLAPTVVEFYSADATMLGDKQSLEHLIHDITRIPAEALRGAPLSDFTVAERESWVHGRYTLREEDIVYCLLGIFNVTMPVVYGEGRKRAQRRLRNEVARMDLRSLSAGSRDAIYSIGLAKSEFRVLVLEPGVMGEDIDCYLEISNLEQPPAYHALSYVWGEEPAIHLCYVDSNAIMIRPSLLQALQRLRRQEGRINIWIDDLCINQKNTLERNAQVKQMAKIYYQASRVFIWLGEHNSTSSLAMDLIRKVAESDYVWETIRWKDHEFTALLSLLSRVWFQRGWIVQEAAFAQDATLCCGDRQVHLTDLLKTVIQIQSQLLLGQSPVVDLPETVDNYSIHKFNDSSAVRLFSLISKAVSRTSHASTLERRLSLENLVDAARFTETSDKRDTIYALLNLANDLRSSPFKPADNSGLIEPNYDKSDMEVFADFILHCCRNGSLDIICRPWAPVSPDEGYPTWIVSRHYLPFGDPCRRLTHRLNGKELVGTSESRSYNCHGGKKPQVTIELHGKEGAFKGALIAKGFIIGEVVRRSARMAGAVITRDCLAILGATPDSDANELSRIIWRILCADRDMAGNQAPKKYPKLIQLLKQLSTNGRHSLGHRSAFDQLLDVDILELLDDDIPSNLREFLENLRDTIWDRRVFQLSAIDSVGTALVGIGPRETKIGDMLCILYGCSVPTVLRQFKTDDGVQIWKLIGGAYVDGVMNGELFQDRTRGDKDEALFDIR